MEPIFEAGASRLTRIQIINDDKGAWLHINHTALSQIDAGEVSGIVSSSGVTYRSIEIFICSKARNLTRCFHIEYWLAFFVIIGDRIMGKSLLGIFLEMLTVEIIIESAVNREILTEGFDHDAVLIRVAMIEASKRTGFEKERNPLRIK